MPMGYNYGNIHSLIITSRLQAVKRKYGIWLVSRIESEGAMTTDGPSTSRPVVKRADIVTLPGYWGHMHCLSTLICYTNAVSMAFMVHQHHLWVTIIFVTVKVLNLCVRTAKKNFPAKKYHSSFLYIGSERKFHDYDKSWFAKNSALIQSGQAETAFWHERVVVPMYWASIRPYDCWVVLFTRFCVTVIRYHDKLKTLSVVPASLNCHCDILGKRELNDAFTKQAFSQFTLYADWKW